MAENVKRKILLIDDDASLLLTLSDFLKFEGYDVTTADSGEKGLKKLQKMTPDLIILDMSMPGMGGVGFLKEISTSEGNPKHPVLVLTARANMAEFFANVTVDGFVAKPCPPEDLLNEVGRIIFQTGGGLQRASSGEGQRRTVLVVEDDPLANNRLVIAFQGANLLVETVRSGPEAIEKAVMVKPDVVVMKLVMATMNGDLVARMLKDLPSTKEIPVILYDESDNKTPESKFTEGSSNVRRFVRRSTTGTLLEAVRGLTE